MWPRINLKPINRPIIVEGIVSYNESCRSRNVIRLKKEIRDEFNDFYNKNRLIRYKMEYYRTYGELLARIRDVIKNNEGFPFLTFFFKDDSAN